jgi:hypothetical protein
MRTRASSFGASARSSDRSIGYTPRAAATALAVRSSRAGRLGHQKIRPTSQKLGLVENGVSCNSCVQQDLSWVCG